MNRERYTPLIGMVWLLVIAYLPPLVAQTGTSEETYVARAGNLFISEREFIQRYEMVPWLYRRKAEIEGAKLELLYSLVAEKLLAQEAESRKFDQDSTFQRAFSEIRKLLARDQLYREEISEKVLISSEEKTRAMRRALESRFVSFLFFESEENAGFVRTQMKTPADFDMVALDSSISVLRDTATVEWGEAEEAIEEAAYQLKPGRISPVIKAGGGYYILRLLDTQGTTPYTGLAPDVLNNRVTTAIRKRKERALMFEFIARQMKDKVGYSLPKAFKRLAKALVKVYQQQDVPLDSTVRFSREMLQQLKHECSASLPDSMVVVGTDVWSLNDVVNKLYFKGFDVPKRLVRGIPGRLNAEIEFWVQQDLIAQEALKRGMDRRPEVQRELDTWYHTSLAEKMKGYARGRVGVTEAEAFAYLKFMDSTVSVPFVQIRELRTGSLEEMRAALADVQSGLTFEEAVVKWSADADAKLRKGVTPFFPITDRAPIGELAYQMQVGQRYGPVQAGGGVVYFELLAKKSVPGVADTSFAEKIQQARTEMLKLKQKGLIDKFLAQVGQRRGVEVYRDRLKKIEVTPFPMVTYRFLGFGGRMFAVPLVDPQVDWLNTEPPKETVLP